LATKLYYLYINLKFFILFESSNMKNLWNYVSFFCYSAKSSIMLFFIIFVFFSGISCKTDSVQINDNIRSDFVSEIVSMVRVQGGTIIMGALKDDKGEPKYSCVDEKGNLAGIGTKHNVTVSSFYMSKYPVTQEQFEAVMGYNLSSNKGANLPVESLSWYDAAEFCNRLSSKEGFEQVYKITNVECLDNVWITDATVIPDWTKNGYRLPTEAEWEYAFRGDYPNKTALSDEITSKGNYTANNYGLYYFTGDILEWCWDRFGDYLSKSQTDPKGPEYGEFRVIRDGSWYDTNQKNVRCFSRGDYNPGHKTSFIGFRLVRRE
jgi:formylglycine-generating enzyme required for sulfatase activity